MTEEQYIALFELKAQQHREIQHNPGTRDAFFYIENVDELGEFDDALRSSNCGIAMLLVANNGEFNDNGTNSYHEDLNGQIYIVIQKTTAQTIRTINELARRVLLNVLARVRKENPTTFRLNNLPYQKVGPMNDEWYGCTAAITFTCPFAFEINNGNWLDIAP